jgi:hypothetical protein
MYMYIPDARQLVTHGLDVLGIYLETLRTVELVLPFPLFVPVSNNIFRLVTVYVKKFNTRL